jgi:hypothetical protein
MLNKLKILQSKVDGNDANMLELIQIFIDEIEADIDGLKASME